jgi:adsorption protein B
MLDWVDIIVCELILFAAVGLLIGGIDDFLIDAIWIIRLLWRRQIIFRIYSPASMETLAPPDRPGRIAVLIGAWHEDAVIGKMLRTALARIDHDDYRIYVGTYANDHRTIAEVRTIARADGRIRLVEGGVHGPTTKGECLNRIWRALLQDEAVQRVRYKAIVIHDAEDVIHSAELKLFDRMIEHFDLVQLPVLPLPSPGSRWVAGHYCDEFAEAHHRQLVVREVLGAGVPSAGVGCAISREAMGRMALNGGGRPFDENCLTEDYEIGLRLAQFGYRGAFVSVPATRGGLPVAVRAHFPETMETAIRQKTRWMIGIALAGWDRLGWHGHWAELWMRLRDRRAILAALVLCASYIASLLWMVSVLGHFALGTVADPLSPTLVTLLQLNAMFLGWRAVMRFGSVRKFYGFCEACRSIPRIVTSNIIAMLAAGRALGEYIKLLRGHALRWDKTRHVFPQALPAE